MRYAKQRLSNALDRWVLFEVVAVGVEDGCMARLAMFSVELSSWLMANM